MISAQSFRGGISAIQVRSPRRDEGFYIPLLPSPFRQILSIRQILFWVISSQNPPALLPQKVVCQHSLPEGEASYWQPPSRVSRKQRYNTLDFPSGKSCAKGCFSPLLDTPAKEAARLLWTPPLLSFLLCGRITIGSHITK